MAKYVCSVCGYVHEGDSAPASDLHNYGLDNPACVVSYRVKNVDYTIRIGNKVQESGDSSSDGTYYTVMVGSNPSIFRVSADSVSFAERDAAGYASDMVYSCDIAKIKTMTVAIDGKTTEFALRHSEGENSGSDEMTVTTGSKTVDDQTFRKMYVNLLSMTSFEHVTDGKDAASPYVKITFTYDDYSRVDTLRFSPYTDRRYFMSLNGSGSTVVLSTAVDAFTESFDAVMATAK